MLGVRGSKFKEWWITNEGLSAQIPKGNYHRFYQS
jgi:hypothetical protein